MVKIDTSLEKIVIQLHDIGAVKFGDFKMKIGVNSPVYFDLRVIVSYPKLLTEVSELFVEFGRKIIGESKHICGVPYAALAIAALVAVKSDRPLLMRRKEVKAHGTKKIIEGVFSKGDTCVIVEDVITSGLSILETVQDLRQEGLEAIDSIVLLDREQGGSDALKSQGLNVHSLLKLTQVLSILHEAGKLDGETVERVKDYIEKNRVYLPENLLIKEVKEVKPEGQNRLQLRFGKRADDARNPVAARLLRLMEDKHTNLCVAVDVDDCATVLDFANQVGPFVCVLKIHADILRDFSVDFAERLKKLAAQHKFLIMEDRKFSDIGSTVVRQYNGGLLRIASWADLVTTQTTPGKGIIDGLKKALDAVDVGHDERACFVVAEMSSEGALTTAQYRAESIKMAESRPDFVAGIVSQSSLGISSLGLIQLTPGVQLSSEDSPAKGDGLGQQYNSPEEVVLKRGADIAVVGRGIIRATDVAEKARKYRDLLWAAYEKRVEP